jgi:hypothetical protein
MSKKAKKEIAIPVAASTVAFKNTTAGKTIRTFFQSAAGILLVFALSDEFRSFITNRFPELAAFIPLAVALFTALQNGVDPNVKNF